MKEPMLRAAWPPKDYDKSHKVQTGENWWSISTKYGTGDPWNIIQFNFGTKDPDEVNWYLFEYVGCRTTTDDKKNLRFSSWDKPGILYVPKPWWHPGGDD